MKFGCLNKHRTLALDALWARPVVPTWVSVPGCLGLGTGRTHRTHRGASGALPTEVCRMIGHRTHAPDLPRCVRSRTPRGLQFTLSPDTGTGPTMRASGVLSVELQLAVNGEPDALCTASGATLSTSGAPIFFGIRVASPWTWWVVFRLLHLIHGRSLAHLISWETPFGAREKQEPREDWELSDFLSQSFSSWVPRVQVCIHHSLEPCLGQVRVLCLLLLVIVIT